MAVLVRKAPLGSTIVTAGAALLLAASPVEDLGPAATDFAHFKELVDEKGGRAQDPLIPQRTKGNSDAPVTIYEVTDFGCPWCREFYRLVLPAIEDEYIDTGKAKLIFVNLPLPQLHPNSPAAHEFAMCAAQQDRFWPVHALLYQHQAIWSPLEEPRAYFTVLADSAGLNVDTLNTCFDTGSARWLVQQEAESVAQQANITSTPSFIMETVLLAGYQPIEGWRPILDSLFAAKTGG